MNRRESFRSLLWPYNWLEARHLASFSGCLMRRYSPARWSPSTAETIDCGLDRWLSYIEFRGKSEDPLLAAADRATLMEYVVFLRDVQHNAPTTIQSRLSQLRRGLGAYFDVTVPSLTITHARSRRPKFVEDKMSSDAFDLGIKLVDSARKSAIRMDERAVLFRDGLMIALAGLTGLRSRNLRSMRVGFELLQIDRSHRIFFASSQTKNGRVIELPWPTILNRELREYLSLWRPVLLNGKKCDFVFATRNGRPMASSNVYNRFAHRTGSEWSAKCGPHEFRKIVARTLLASHPGEPTLPADILAITNRIADKHYRTSVSQYGRTSFVFHTMELKSKLLGKADFLRLPQGAESPGAPKAQRRKAF